MRKFFRFFIVIALFFSLTSFFFGYVADREVNEQYDFSSRLTGLADIVSQFGEFVRTSSRDMPGIQKYMSEQEWPDYSELFSYNDDQNFFEKVWETLKSIVLSIFNAVVSVNQFTFVFLKLFANLMAFGLKVGFNFCMLIVNIIVFLLGGSEQLWLLSLL